MSSQGERFICQVCNREFKVPVVCANKADSSLITIVPSSSSQSDVNDSSAANKKCRSNKAAICGACKKFYSRSKASNASIFTEKCSCPEVRYEPDPSTDRNPYGRARKLSQKQLCRACRARRCHAAMVDSKCDGSLDVSTGELFGSRMASSASPGSIADGDSPGSSGTAQPNKNAAEGGRSERINVKMIPCEICGVSSSGYHFGVISCEGCKGFFRRSITKKSEYKCKSSETESPEKRNGRDHQMKCKKCRFDACINAGMSLSAVQTGRHSMQRKIETSAYVKRLAAENRLLSAPVMRAKSFRAIANPNSDEKAESGDLEDHDDDHNKESRPGTAWSDNSSDDDDDGEKDITVDGDDSDDDASVTMSQRLAGNFTNSGSPTGSQFSPGNKIPSPFPVAGVAAGDCDSPSSSKKIKLETQTNPNSPLLVIPSPVHASVNLNQRSPSFASTPLSNLSLPGDSFQESSLQQMLPSPLMFGQDQLQRTRTQQSAFSFTSSAILRSPPSSSDHPSTTSANVADSLSAGSSSSNVLVLPSTTLNSTLSGHFSAHWSQFNVGRSTPQTSSSQHSHQEPSTLQSSLVPSSSHHSTTLSPAWHLQHRPYSQEDIRMTSSVLPPSYLNQQAPPNIAEFASKFIPMNVGAPIPSQLRALHLDSFQSIAQRLVESNSHLARINSIPELKLTFDMDPMAAWTQVMHKLFGNFVNAISSFVRLLPGFRELCQADRVVLFTQAYFPILVAQLSLTYDAASKLPNYFCETTPEAREMLKYLLCGPGDMLERQMGDSGYTITTWKPTTLEFSLFCGLLFFDPTVPELTEPEKVRQISEAYRMADESFNAERNPMDPRQEMPSTSSSSAVAGSSSSLSLERRSSATRFSSLVRYFKPMYHLLGIVMKSIEERRPDFVGVHPLWSEMHQYLTSKLASADNLFGNIDDLPMSSDVLEQYQQ